eukprot:m.131273 g.131273  ORF g.131273 m.131273 type:complete len:950 (-) comp14621_c0_seq1:883-3732(-)
MSSRRPLSLKTNKRLKVPSCAVKKQVAEGLHDNKDPKIQQKGNDEAVCLSQKDSSCMVCNADLSHLNESKRQVHINEHFLSPLKQEKTACVDPVISSPILCPGCGKLLQHMTEQQRLQHVNRCMDDSENTQPKSSDEQKDQHRKGKVESLRPCPFCTRTFNKENNKARLAHIKKCGVSHGFSAAAVITAVKGPQAHVNVPDTDIVSIGTHQVPQVGTASSEKEDNEFKPPSPSVERAKKKRKKAPGQKQATINLKKDEDLQVALALSASLDHTSDVKPKKKKLSKQEQALAKPVPKLLLTSQDERVQNRAIRVETILAKSLNRTEFRLLDEASSNEKEILRSRTWNLHLGIESPHSSKYIIPCLRSDDTNEKTEGGIIDEPDASTYDKMKEVSPLKHVEGSTQESCMKALDSMLRSQTSPVILDSQGKSPKKDSKEIVRLAGDRDTLMAQLAALVDCNVGSDVLFIPNDTLTPVYAHHAMLATRCGRNSTILQELETGQNENTDTIKVRRVSLNFSAQTIRCVLSFIYTGSCSFDRSLMKSVSELAPLLDVPDLIEAISKQVKEGFPHSQSFGSEKISTKATQSSSIIGEFDSNHSRFSPPNLHKNPIELIEEPSDNCNCDSDSLKALTETEDEDENDPVLRHNRLEAELKQPRTKPRLSEGYVNLSAPLLANRRIGYKSPDLESKENLESPCLLGSGSDSEHDSESLPDIFPTKDTDMKGTETLATCESTQLLGTDKSLMEETKECETTVVSDSDSLPEVLVQSSRREKGEKSSKLEQLNTPELRKQARQYGIKVSHKTKADLVDKLAQIEQYQASQNLTCTSHSNSQNLGSQNSTCTGGQALSDSCESVNESDLDMSEGCSVSAILRNQVIDYLKTQDKAQYERMLAYEPVDITELHNSLNRAGILCSQQQVINCLDKESITYAQPPRKNNGKQKRNRRKKAKQKPS